MTSQVRFVTIKTTIDEERKEGKLNVFREKFLETIYSVLPITGIVMILSLTCIHLELPELFRFLLGAFIITIGLSLFLIGVDIGITPIGTHISTTLVRTNKIAVVVVANLVLGFIISVAEPDLHILAGQVETVTAGSISKLGVLIVVSIGIAVMLTLGIIRILFNIPLYRILTVLYGIILLLALFVSPEFLAISFDASGATTGAMTVPFIMALSLGASVMKKDSKGSEKDSFGLVAIASAGAVMGVMLMSILSKKEGISGSLPVGTAKDTSVLGPFLHNLPHIAGELGLALCPFLFLFLVFQVFLVRLSGRAFGKIMVGLLYTFLGLLLFLSGVNSGFMDVGTMVGYRVASMENKSLIILVAFLLGLVTILAEPAVHVLTRQIEEVTSGYVKKTAVLISLCAGVALAVALSIIRILVPGLELWHYLLPGYLIAIGLSYIAPKLFVGIAFDAGGVATGPMTATFILAFTQGAAGAIEGADVLRDGFGMIAMVAMMPIITLQLLGVIYKIKSQRGGIHTNDRES